ncbi:MAG: nucleoside kinase [Bacteroidota bacterium]|nr:nucleoside kinase [Bacteroidota bacterium]
MTTTLKVRCLNTNTERDIPAGTNLHQLAELFNLKSRYPFLGAMVNNKVKEMAYEIYKPKTVEFYDLTHKDGMRMYIRSLYFLLMKAVDELNFDTFISIEHSVSNGFFCEIRDSKQGLNEETIENIKRKMNELVKQDLPFIRNEILNSEVIKIFENSKMPEKARLFKQSPSLYTSVYTLGDMTDYFYGFLVPSTGCLKKFGLKKFYNGMLLRVPNRGNPEKLRPFTEQDKMFEVLEEHKYRVEVLQAANIGQINEKVLKKQAGDLIKIGEALHEKKISTIAEQISQKESTKLILVSGPSSSGKTTFSKRLFIQFRVAGVTPVMVSLDNYFVDREKTPLDENGDYDFESIEALDLDLLNKDLNTLLEGGIIKVPTFDFADGTRHYNGDTMSLKNGGIIIAEGIHALNPRLTKDVDNMYKYRVYVSALTQICIDQHNRIPTTDNRLLRRMIRDHNFRGYSALDTLKRWDSVRRGEKRNIFPYQEQADIMFNSALIYELGVLKKHAEPLLKEIWQNQKEYAEAQRLLKFLSYFKDIPEREIPPTSILREFLGNSTFDY